MLSSRGSHGQASGGVTSEEWEVYECGFSVNEAPWESLLQYAPYYPGMSC